MFVNLRKTSKTDNIECYKVFLFYRTECALNPRATSLSIEILRQSST